LHCFHRINPSVEANLSHLSISYSGLPSASSTSSAAPAAGTDTPAPDSPLGFLSALVDQLLAGSPPAADTTADTSGQPAPATTTSVDGLANLNLDVSAQPPVPLKTVALFSQLTKAMKAIQAELDAGQKPTDAELKKLGNMVDALASLIAAPAPPPATPAPVDPTTTMDPLQAIAAADTTPAPALPDMPDTKPAKDNSAADQLNQLLAGMGITLPANPSPPTDTSAADTAASVGTTAPSTGTQQQPLPAVAQLASQLAELTAAIRPVATDVAQKLDALTQKLSGAETDPSTALAQLTGKTDSGGAALDKLVQQLISAKPVAAPTPTTPQLASNTKLDIPAPIAPSTSTVTTPDQPVAPDPTQQTTSVDPKTALKSPAAVQTPDPAPSDKPKSDVTATATTIADTAKSDTPDTTAQAQPANATAPVTQNAPARAIPAAYQTASNPINMGQVAFEMARQLHQGQSRFTIRIDPPELGRVDVKMHVDSAGNVNARLTVERSETLDMFQRDRGSLEKALTQAGLDSGKTNLEFSLKQNPFAGMTGGDQRQQGGGYAGARFASADDDAAMPPTINLYRGTASAGGVNIFA
jgi:flagellar hook-length control protein FliK